MNLLLLKKRNYKIIIILLILCVLAGLTFFDYAFKNNKVTNKAVYNLAKKTNESLSLTLYNKLNDTTLILTSLAKQASEYDDIKSPVMLNVLHDLTMEDNYLDLSITTKDGTTIEARTFQTIDHQNADFFKVSMTGKNHLSELKNSQDKKAQVITLSVPIWKGDSVDGVISCTIDIQMFSEILNLAMTEDGQNAILVQKDGTILAKTEDIDSDNFYTSLENATINDENTLETIQADFKHEIHGNIHYTLKNVERLAYFCSVKDSDWTIVTIFPYQVISTQVAEGYKHSTEFSLKLVCLLVGALIIILYYERKATHKAKSINAQLDAVIDNTPGCLIMYEYHNHKNIRFLNDEFYNISGYTKKEFEEIFNNDLSLIIQSDDLHTLRQKLYPDVNDSIHGSSLSYSYRILHKNGEFIWVMDRRHLVHDNHGKQWFYITLVDITELKNMQEKLRISQKRYEMIIEQTESVVFEWDVQRDILTLSDLWKKKFGFDTTFTNFLMVTEANYEVEESSYIPLMEAFIRGQQHGQIECKLRKVTGESIWCKITARAINDSFGYLMTVFGSIEDIDNIKSKTLLLEERSKIDGLTKILNKTTGEEEIENIIEHNDGTKHALFVIDIDDFKIINDTLGHAVGDLVLSKLGIAIKQCFRNNDIIARIGGDEFVAFMLNIDTFDMDFIEKKVNRVLQAIHSIKVDALGDFSITCSIGIAMYPEQGSTYKELFIQADQALYSAKNSGKNQFCIQQKKK